MKEKSTIQRFIFLYGKCSAFILSHSGSLSLTESSKVLEQDSGRATNPRRQYGEMLKPGTEGRISYSCMHVYLCVCSCMCASVCSFECTGESRHWINGISRNSWWFSSDVLVEGEEDKDSLSDGGVCHCKDERMRQSTDRCTQLDQECQCI